MDIEKRDRETLAPALEPRDLPCPVDPERGQGAKARFRVAKAIVVHRVLKMRPQLGGLAGGPAEFVPCEQDRRRGSGEADAHCPVRFACDGHDGRGSPAGGGRKGPVEDRACEGSIKRHTFFLAIRFDTDWSRNQSPARTLAVVRPPGDEF